MQVTPPARPTRALPIANAAANANAAAGNANAAAANANVAAAHANATAANANVAAGAANVTYQMGAVYGALPAGCISPNVSGGGTYYLCGNTWFSPSYGANGVLYRVWSQHRKKVCSRQILNDDLKRFDEKLHTGSNGGTGCGFTVKLVLPSCAMAGGSGRRRVEGATRSAA